MTFSVQVKYKGRKLDQFKTTWFKKQRTGSSAQVLNDVDQVLGFILIYLFTIPSSRIYECHFHDILFKKLNSNDFVVQSSPTVFSSSQSTPIQSTSSDTSQAASAITTSALISPLKSPPGPSNDIAIPKVIAHRGPGRPRLTSSPSRKAASTRPPGRPRLKSPGTPHGIR